MIVTDAGRSLGIAVAGLVNILNVRRILITGRAAALGAPLGAHVR